MDEGGDEGGVDFAAQLLGVAVGGEAVDDPVEAVVDGEAAGVCVCVCVCVCARACVCVCACM